MYVGFLWMDFELFSGIEFSLTAFENPGLSLPSSITTWVALRAMPEFMGNLRKACLDMRKWKQQHAAAKNGGHKQVSLITLPLFLYLFLDTWPILAIRN